MIQKYIYHGAVGVKIGSLFFIGIGLFLLFLFWPSAGGGLIFAKFMGLIMTFIGLVILSQVVVEIRVEPHGISIRKFIKLVQIEREKILTIKFSEIGLNTAEMHIKPRLRGQIPLGYRFLIINFSYFRRKKQYLPLKNELLTLYGEPME